MIGEESQLEIIQQLAEDERIVQIDKNGKVTYRYKTIIPVDKTVNKKNRIVVAQYNKLRKEGILSTYNRYIRLYEKEYEYKIKTKQEYNNELNKKKHMTLSKHMFFRGSDFLDDDYIVKYLINNYIVEEGHGLRI